MTFFLLKASGTLGGTFPWSFGSVGQSTSSEAAVATSWDTAIQAIFGNATLKTYFPTGVVLTQTSASTASDTFKQTTKTYNDDDVAGTSEDPALPYRTCEIVTFRNQYATRYGRGRWFLPPMAYNALAADGFSLLADAQAAIVTGIEAFFSEIAGTITLVTLCRNGTIDKLVPPYSTFTVTAADCPNTFATQKRRADKIVPTRSTITV